MGHEAEGVVSGSLMPGVYGYEYGKPVGNQVVRALGGKPTPEKMRFFEAWAKAEGTKAQYNPFATTRKGFAGETNFNSVGVKNYPDLQTGIKATIDTLNLGYYKHVVELLRRDDVTAEQLGAAIADSPWGTGSGVLRVLGVTAADGYEKAKSAAKFSAQKQSLDQIYQTRSLERFRPSQQYMNTLEKLGSVGAPALSLASGFQPFRQQVPAGAAAGLAPGIASMPGDSGKANHVQRTKEGLLILPMSWKADHETDNLGWGTESAIDIMGDPGTPVGAMEAGEVRTYNPTGAQGGGSMVFVGDSGNEYWLGHITDAVVGTRVKRGGVIAYISPDHPRPHVHVDKRPAKRRRK